MRVSHFQERTLAEAGAKVLAGLGYVRRRAEPRGGECRVIAAEGGGFDLEWQPLPWNIDMLASLRRSDFRLSRSPFMSDGYSVFDLIDGSPGSVLDVLRLLSSSFPDREASLAALNTLEVLASKGEVH